MNQHGQSNITGIQNTLSTTPQKTDVAKFGNPSPSTASKEETKQNKTGIRKPTHRTEFHPTYLFDRRAAPSEEISHKRIQAHIVFKVKSAKNGAIQTPAK
jgi:hypothetical protein